MARSTLIRPVVAALVLALLAGCTPRSAAEELDAATRVQQMYAKYKADDFPSVPDMSAVAARALLDSTNAVLLDVREDRERRVSIIPGAIDRRRFEAMVDSLGERPVIVYCTIGYRSAKATLKLRKKGVNATNIAGGILAWSHAGGEVIDPATGESTHKLHVYGSRWNLLPPGWEGIW